MRTILLAIGMLQTGLAVGQQINPPTIEWQQELGGGDRELLQDLQQLDDGYIVGGISFSPQGGNKTAPHFGAEDYWVVRLNSQGKPLWDRSFGGSASDFLQGVRKCSDGGSILVGGSTSETTGNKTSPRYGTGPSSQDGWVIRIDREGNKVWEQSYGGTRNDWVREVEETSEGGFFLSGVSSSPPTTNKTAAAYGLLDFWVVKIDRSGLRFWDQSFGGNGHDLLWAAQKTVDGGVVLGGGSQSPPSGNKRSQHFGDYDFWIVRLDAHGNKLWDASFGGTNDDTLYCLGQMPDGGFVAAGRSRSPPGGNKSSPNLGGADFWVVRLDEAGNKLWEGTFGGSDEEYPNSLEVTRDGGVILAGWSTSPVSGNKTAVGFGGVDGWVVRLDADGNKLWDACYGGSKGEQLHAVQQTHDGGFILGGWSASPPDGNKTTPDPAPFEDFWVIKLGAEQPQLRVFGPPETIGGLQLLLTGIKNLSYAVDRSSDLALWVTLQTNRLTNSTWDLQDTAATNLSQRFYRARLVPAL